MFRKVVFVVALLIGALPVQAKAKSFVNFGLNEDEVKEIVRKYIYDNPQIIVESFQRMQMLEEQNRQRQARARLGEFRKDFWNNPRFFRKENQKARFPGLPEFRKL